MPAPFLSHTHFSINVDRKDGTISVTDYSRNGTYIKRNKIHTDNENIADENVDAVKIDDINNKEECELIGSNKTVTVLDGDAIVLRFKQENKLMFCLKLEKGSKLVDTPPNGSPTSMVLSADDSLQSQITTLLAENSKQERVIAESLAKNENLSKELLSVNRELTNLQTIAQSKDTTITEMTEVIKEFETVSSAKDARLHQFEGQIESLQQEYSELKSKHAILSEDLLRKSELIEKRDEMINTANQAYENEKKQVIELSAKLEVAEVNNKNAVNANLALQDLIQDRSMIDEKMVKNNTELYDLLKKITVAKANDNDKKMKANQQLATILRQCLELVVPESEVPTELDTVLGGVDLASYDISIREHLMLVETPSQASIVDNAAPKGSVHTLTAASLDDTIDDLNVKVVKVDMMEIEENYVEVTKIREYHSDTDSDEDEKCKWNDRMMMTTQMPHEDQPESSHDSHEHESANVKDESININESQFADEGSLKGSLLDVGFSNDSLKNINDNEEQKLEVEINPEEIVQAIPSQVQNAIADIVVAVEENDKNNDDAVVVDSVKSRSPSKRTADDQEIICSSSEKKTKFSHEVTIINNVDENDNYNMNINMSYHCESTCASLVEN